MEALQKFKMLATHCAVMGENPTRSPRTSPNINIRRRITLRMLLSRNGSGSVGGNRRLPQRRQEKASPDRQRKSDKGNELVVVRQQLRDLFVMSTPDFDEKVSGSNVREGVFVAAGLAGSGGGGGFGSKRNGDKSPRLRPVSATFRQRLLRRSWKPVLVTIPE